MEKSSGIQASYRPRQATQADKISSTLPMKCRAISDVPIVILSGLGINDKVLKITIANRNCV